MINDSFRVFVGGYKGTSLISRVIKALIWKRFSHVSLINSNETTIQSWHMGGTQKHEHPWVLHTPGTPIDIFALDSFSSEMRLAVTSWPAKSPVESMPISSLMAS